MTSILSPHRTLVSQYWSLWTNLASDVCNRSWQFPFWVINPLYNQLEITKPNSLPLSFSYGDKAGKNSLPTYKPNTTYLIILIWHWVGLDNSKTTSAWYSTYLAVTCYRFQLNSFHSLAQMKYEQRLKNCCLVIIFRLFRSQENQRTIRTNDIDYVLRKGLLLLRFLTNHL